MLQLAWVRSWRRREMRRRVHRMVRGGVSSYGAGGVSLIRFLDRFFFFIEESGCRLHASLLFDGLRNIWVLQTLVSANTFFSPNRYFGGQIACTSCRNFFVEHARNLSLLHDV